jgi:excisionase family DNA binding protein
VVVIPSSEAVGGSATLTPVEVAEQLAVSASSVRRWLLDGTLPGIRIAGRYRVEQAALDGLIQRAGPAGNES